MWHQCRRSKQAPAHGRLLPQALASRPGIGSAYPGLAAVALAYMASPLCLPTCWAGVAEVAAVHNHAGPRQRALSRRQRGRNPSLRAAGAAGSRKLWRHRNTQLWCRHAPRNPARKRRQVQAGELSAAAKESCIPHCCHAGTMHIVWAPSAHPA